MNDANTKKLKIVTHSGSFHTDEVFACAILSLLHGGNVEIVRSRDKDVWATGDYVVDVGYVYDPIAKRFDHHQEGGAGARENGIPYSALGLVWKEYGEKLTGDKITADRIDKKLVQPVDAADCGIDTFNLTELGVFPYILHHVVSSFRPTWKEESEGIATFDEGFKRAILVAKDVLLREIIIARDNQEGAQYVEDVYKNTEDKRLIIVEGQQPWEEVLTKYPEPFFVVKPDRSSTRWKVRTVRIHHESFASRKDFPKGWAGKKGEELAHISGVPDAIFCHNSGSFIVTAGSKEGALALAQLALNA